MRHVDEPWRFQPLRDSLPSEVAWIRKERLSLRCLRLDRAGAVIAAVITEIDQIRAHLHEFYIASRSSLVERSPVVHVGRADYCCFSLNGVLKQHNCFRSGKDERGILPEPSSLFHRHPTQNIASVFRVGNRTSVVCRNTWPET